MFLSNFIIIFRSSSGLDITYDHVEIGPSNLF